MTNWFESNYSVSDLFDILNDRYYEVYGVAGAANFDNMGRCALVRELENLEKIEARRNKSKQVH